METRIRFRRKVARARPTVGRGTVGGCRPPGGGVPCRKVSWTFVYLMVALKIPIAALLYLVWWAIHQTPETTENGSGDGGTKRPRHPRPPLPRRPRHRGGHGLALPSPPRTRRAVLARGRPHPVPAASKHR